jgi:hypothetical protein
MDKKSKYSLLIIFISGLIFISGCVNIIERNSTLKFNLSVDSKGLIEDNFDGFGFEWDSRNYSEARIDKDEFELITKRLDWMQPSIVRVMILTKWCYDPKIGYTWNSKELKELYKILEYCQQNNVDVLLTVWGLEVQHEWNKVEDIKRVEDPRYAEVISNYLSYLIHKKGFSCIKYLGFVNEPNYGVGDFDRWGKGMLNLINELSKKGLKDKILVTGSGESNDFNWHKKTVNELFNIIDVYTTHIYESIKDVRERKLQIKVSNYLEYIKDNDPYGNTKKLFISEAGMKDGQTAEKNTNIDSYNYGVFMTDYAIQAVLGGASSVIAWMLDDNSHPNFEWGLWKSKEHKMELRPWFYTWSLLTKYFPKGSKIYNIRTRSINLRAIVAEINKSGEKYWTYVFINLEKFSVELNTKQELGTISKFKRYLYYDGKLNVDKNGFPVPFDTLTIDLNKGGIIDCPPNSVSVITNYN